MTKLLNYLMLVLIPIFSMCLTSCGDNDEDEPESANIIGTWRSDHENGYVIYNFKKNSTYSRIDFDYEYGTWSESGTYIVRADKYITVTTTSGDIETCTILLLTDNQMTLCWESDDVLTFIRQ